MRSAPCRREGGGLRPVAFLDWDAAAPGQRIHDVAHLCWQYLDLGPTVPDVAEAARGLRLICDAYGLGARDELLDVVLWWQERCWRGIEAEAEAGEPAMLRLRSEGVPELIRVAQHWVEDNRGPLGRSL